MIDLFDPGDVSSAGYRHTDTRLTYDAAFLDEVDVEQDAGVSGLTLWTGKVEWSGDYMNDARFRHTPERDRVRRRDRDPFGHRGTAAPARRGDRRGDGLRRAPGCLRRAGCRGARRARRPGRGRDRQRAPDRASSSASREETPAAPTPSGRCAEIAVRVSSILDPTEVLDRIVVEAARLLDSDGSRIDLWDDASESLLWAYSAGDAMRDVPEWGRTGGIKPGQAVAGLAFAGPAAVHDRGLPGRQPRS